eukprot:UN03383
MKHRREPTDIIIAGMSLKSAANTQQIKKFVREQDVALIFYKNKKKEIEDRGNVAITSFGEDVGCEIDEIAVTLYKIPNSAKLWQKWAGKPALTRQTNIYKMLYGLTVLTLRKKNPRAKKPPGHPIKLLTSKLCKKLPKRKGKKTLTKKYFVKKCHNTLFALHQEMVNV